MGLNLLWIQNNNILVFTSNNTMETVDQYRLIRNFNSPIKTINSGFANNNLMNSSPCIPAQPQQILSQSKFRPIKYLFEYFLVGLEGRIQQQTKPINERKTKIWELFEKFVPDTTICIEKYTKILYEKINRKDIPATKIMYDFLLEKLMAKYIRWKN